MFNWDRVGLIVLFFIPALWQGQSANPTLFSQNLGDGCDLNLPLPFSLVWRKDNGSPLLARFVADVRLLPEVRRFLNGKDGTGIRAGS